MGDMSNLNARAWLGLIFLFAVMGLLLFLSAGTIHYWQAWAYLAVFFAASLLITLYLRGHDPELLARRVRSGPTAEKEVAERIIMSFTAIGFVALLTVPALDYHFGWSEAPLPVVIGGDA